VAQQHGVRPPVEDVALEAARAVLAPLELHLVDIHAVA